MLKLKIFYLEINAILLKIMECFSTIYKSLAIANEVKLKNNIYKLKVFAKSNKLFTYFMKFKKYIIESKILIFHILSYFF